MDLADTVAGVGTQKQQQIKPRFKLSLDYLKINIQCMCQTGCRSNRGKLIWSALAALWSNLTGGTERRYRVAGVCPCLCVCAEPGSLAPTLSLLLSRLPPLYSPFEDKTKK